MSSAATPSDPQRDLLRRQHEQHGGMKVGAAFFGWLTATGAFVVLTVLLATVGVGLGGTGLLDVMSLAEDLQAVGLLGTVVVLVVVLLSYLAGGYVAGRMARFDGVRQGIGVWLWGIIATVVVAVLGLVIGSLLELPPAPAGVPTAPVDGAMTTGGILAGVLLGLVSLLGAVLGGLAGMHFHRKVDQTPGYRGSGPAMPAR